MIREFQRDDINKVAEKIKNRQKRGKNFSVVVVAEGAKPIGGDITCLLYTSPSPRD